MYSVWCGDVRSLTSRTLVSYTFCMTKLLDETIDRLPQSPEGMQDAAARAVLLQLEEEPEPGDTEAIAAGREDFQRGDFVTLEQWRNEMGLGDR
jgi:hypothetical protein